MVIVKEIWELQKAIRLELPNTRGKYITKYYTEGWETMSRWTRQDLAEIAYNNIREDKDIKKSDLFRIHKAGIYGPSEHV